MVKKNASMQLKPSPITAQDWDAFLKKVKG